MKHEALEVRWGESGVRVGMRAGDSVGIGGADLTGTESPPEVEELADMTA